VKSPIPNPPCSIPISVWFHSEIKFSHIFGGPGEVQIQNVAVRACAALPLAPETIDKPNCEIL